MRISLTVATPHITAGVVSEALVVDVRPAASSNRSPSFTN